MGSKTSTVWICCTFTDYAGQSGITDSKTRGLECTTLQERGKLIKGDAWERSSLQNTPRPHKEDFLFLLVLVDSGLYW